MMTVPQKYQSRQAEITQQFITAVNKHIDSILDGSTDHMYHIKDIARIMFIHPVHLSNTIKLHTGHAPCYYFEKKLMEEAKNMLADDQLTITDIATRLTFDNSNFTKFFKRFEGVTPSAYRQQQAAIAAHL
ncbi:helix-turn-helix domain-containing protein [Chitinophaga nivalis]|uniref:AraC family transcriptional regulator n=1 Tax=Chitinophaga nivalis TaxID=2991709 RepID=A0ABT3IP24_9BACT|nr:AraC family transcriptional regulator [Chitinophaga nivalis]MCW3464583.1 AraC family transcriptional regulator [Chitinophaga nivalis]MCW3485726.1 AraC family transcriptional regulator [Chitinophaga nivalis]